MTHEEFVTWLADEVRGRRMDEAQMQDLLRQKTYFDESRSEFERSLTGSIVGYVAGQQKVAQGLHELLDEVKIQFPGKMIYFEPIGFFLV